MGNHRAAQRIELVSSFLSSDNLPDDVGAHQAIELADGREELFG
jgi:hypothetical protein